MKGFGPYAPPDLIPMRLMSNKTFQVYNTLLIIGILVKEYPIPHESKTPMTTCVKNLGNRGKGMPREA